MILGIRMTIIYHNNIMIYNIMFIMYTLSLGTMEGKWPVETGYFLPLFIFYFLSRLIYYVFFFLELDGHNSRFFNPIVVLYIKSLRLVGK